MRRPPFDRGWPHPARASSTWPTLQSTLARGTRSSGSPVKFDLAFVRDQAVNIKLMLHSHGLLEHDHVIWFQYGLTEMLRYASAGGVSLAWFYLLKTLPPKIKTAGHYMAALSRLVGNRLPSPVYLDVRD